MHCHTEFHNVGGMSLVLKVGEEHQMNAPPSDQRTCGDFLLDDAAFKELNITNISGSHERISEFVTRILYILLEIEYFCK